MDYRPRVADNELERMRRTHGAVLIEGPKACGKTETASRVANTIIRIDEDEAAQTALSLDPSLLFVGEPPILFDEWQFEPAIWNRVRREVDRRRSRAISFSQALLDLETTPRATLAPVASALCG